MSAAKLTKSIACRGRSDLDCGRLSASWQLYAWAVEGLESRPAVVDPKRPKRPFLLIAGGSAFGEAGGMSNKKTERCHGLSSKGGSRARNRFNHSHSLAY